MAVAELETITSRENPLVKTLRKLSQEPAAYRKEGRFWIEGEHLCQTYAQKVGHADVAVYSQHFWQFAGESSAKFAIKNIVISDALMAEISTLESVAGMGLLCTLPAQPALQPLLPTVVLDRLQDPGNVGSILRSAAAFGFKQVLALKGTAALYAPKVLRAGMGAHFGLHLVESVALQDVALLQHPLAVTSSHQGLFLHQLLSQGQLPAQLNWALGHEGQGVCEALQAAAQWHVRIAQPGGEESLNVAVAAAICLHASASAGL